MKIDKKNKTKTSLNWKFTLEAAELAAAEKEALKILAKDVKVKGFRPGKAPINAIKKEIDPNALADKTTEIAINKALIDALIKDDIRPIDQPAISLEKFVPGQTLEFKAEFDILPPVKLPNYKNLKVKQAKVEVEADEIKQTLDHMQKGFAEEKAVKRAAKLGDKTIINFTGILDGEEFEGGKAEDFPLELGSGQFIPGFEDGIVGKKAGQEFDLELTFPKDYHADKLKGKKVTFKTKLKEVKELVLPKLDDKFAKKVSNFKTLADLKADIKKNLTEQKELQAKEAYKNQLVEKLADKTKLEVPTSLLDSQIKAIEQEMAANLMRYGQTLDQYLKSIKKDKQDWLDTDVKQAATARIKAGLVIAELAKELKMTANEDEVKAEIDKLKMQYQNSEEALKQIESPATWRDVENNIITNKTVEKLVEFNS